jgi:hypothetical protein
VEEAEAALIFGHWNLVMVQDDGLIATVRGRPVLQIFS